MIKQALTLPDDAPGYCKAIQDTIWFILAGEEDWEGFGGIYFGKSHPYLGPSYVKPEYRGKGIQRELIKFRLDWLKSGGYTKAITSIDDFNKVSIRNILACGFVEVSQYDEQYIYEINLEKQ